MDAMPSGLEPRPVTGELRTFGPAPSRGYTAQGRRAWQPPEELRSDSHHSSDQDRGPCMSTLNIGHIPARWSGNEDDGETIEIGNPSFSGTAEVTIAFDEDGVGTVSDDTKVTFESLDALCDGDTDDASALAALIQKRLAVKVPKARLAKALRVVAQGSDEWEDDSAIEFITEDGPEIAGGKAYAGKAYVHYFDMDAERDRVIVLLK